MPPALTMYIAIRVNSTKTLSCIRVTSTFKIVKYYVGLNFVIFLIFGRFTEAIKTQQQYMASSDGDRNPAIPEH